MTPRIALEPVRVGDTDMPQGSALKIDAEQVHHDPAAFEDPGRFLVGRRGPSLLSFGAGAHACLGAGLACLEAAQFVKAILSNFDIEAAGEAVWDDHPDMRRLKRLDIVLHPTSRRGA